MAGQIPPGLIIAGIFFGALVVLATLIKISRVIVYVPNNMVGVVEKLWSLGGSIESGIIALDHKAGFQSDLLRGGIHFFTPFQYRIHKLPLVTVPQGRIGYVFARDGKPLQPSQTLAANDVAQNFEDAREFLKDGQKGPQRKLLREGTYALNLALFVVITGDAAAFSIYTLNLNSQEQAMFQGMAKVINDRSGFSPVIIRDADDTIGIVTVHDGPSLTGGEIIAPIVGDEKSNHNNFQNPDVFLKLGGLRGRQYQVLVEGTYYINRLFATVELVPKTVVSIGFVGVVVSYTGKQGQDVSGDTYRHGEMVNQGFKGVWDTPLLPGKYAFNIYAGNIVLVPVTNFILKWSNEVTESHKLDENLSEISLITKDAFEPQLPLSVVLHIDYSKAPLVIQRFGDIKRLVEQTLDPMVSAYFKNIGQNRTLIELLQDRSQIQNQSQQEMRSKFAEYNLELQEVLIGTPHPPADKTGSTSSIEQILIQLRDRQVAREQVETYKLQQAAAEQERSLRESAAKAAQQAEITKSALDIQIRENVGKADLAKAQQDAERVKVEARANAERLKMEGEGEASRVQQIGFANAAATQKQVEAYGGPQYQMLQQVMTRIAEAAEKGQIPLVPQIMVGGGAAGPNGSPMQGGGLIEGLLALMLSEKLQKPVPPAKPAVTASPG
ncbi:MAG TPA: SPFH domain-containing protein [Phycisphaerae bacterium]|nr:SPFH domain-containing protein [Phycisphaerae bacterium]